MSAARWFKSLSVLLALFAVGHTLGTFSPKVTRGSEEAAVFAAMQGFRFHVMGFDRTYWEFYRGLAITVSAALVMMSIMAWQLAGVSERQPESARPLAWSLCFGCVSLLVLGWQFFFAVPIVMSAVAVGISVMSLLALRRPLSSVG